MNQFFKLTKTKIKITIYFIVLSFLFSALFLIINRALISNTSEEELYFLTQYVLPVPSFILSTLEFYLYACLAIYIIKKEKKSVLSVFRWKQFLKISKTKIIITFSLIIMSFVWAMIISYSYRMLLNIIDLKDIEYYMNYVLPAIFFILYIFKLYLFTCLTVYLAGKNKNICQLQEK